MSEVAPEVTPQPMFDAATMANIASANEEIDSSILASLNAPLANVEPKPEAVDQSKSILNVGGISDPNFDSSIATDLTEEQKAEALAAEQARLEAEEIAKREAEEAEIARSAKESARPPANSNNQQHQGNYEGPPATVTGLGVALLGLGAGLRLAGRGAANTFRFGVDQFQGMQARAAERASANLVGLHQDFKQSSDVLTQKMKTHEATYGKFLERVEVLSSSESIKASIPNPNDRFNQALVIALDEYPEFTEAKKWQAMLASTDDINLEISAFERSFLELAKITKSSSKNDKDEVDRITTTLSKALSPDGVLADAEKARSLHDPSGAEHKARMERMRASLEASLEAIREFTRSIVGAFRKP